MSQELDPAEGLYGSPLPPTDQRRAIRTGRVPVAVYGLGKMGLPLASVFADLTGATVGVDIDPAVARAVDAGDCPVDGEPGLDEAVADAVERGALSATDDPVTAARDARVHVLIVPTLVDDGVPDLSNLTSAARAVADGLTPGDLVCIESTVPPRTARTVVEPLLAERSACAREEFGVAVCPERTASGRALQDIRGAYPKVVGGTDAEATRAAATLYGEVTDNSVQQVADATTAECVKVFEGVYRDVNIALANELARLADELGVDVRAAIETANSQPYCDIHRPGPGVGGHCIPYYPYFLVEPLDTATPLLRTARWVNDSMPAYTVRRLLAAMESNGIATTDADVAILGVAYRPGVAETAESPGLEVARLLDEIGLDVSLVDPIVDLSTTGFPAIAVDELGQAGVDAVVYVTDHDAFDSVPWSALSDTLVLDGRGALEGEELPVTVSTLGVGEESQRESREEEEGGE